MLRPIGLLFALSATLSAQDPPPPQTGATPPGAAQGAAPPRGGPRPFAEVTRGAEHRPGFFDTYQKDNQVWIAIPRDRLGQDFLMEMKLAQGIGANGLFGGTMLNLFEANVMTLERRGADHGRRAQRQQSDHRTDLQPLARPVGQAQDVVEEAVLVVPHLVGVVADGVGLRLALKRRITTTSSARTRSVMRMAVHSRMPSWKAWIESMIGVTDGCRPI